MAPLRPERHVDTRAQSNLLRAKLGLKPTESPNGHSDAARELAEDSRSAFGYCNDLIAIIPKPPKDTEDDSVRGYLLLVYEWGNFILAGVGALVDHIEAERHGASVEGSPTMVTGNILHELYAGLGVRLKSPMVFPRAFADAGRPWDANERRSALAAVANARAALEDTVLKGIERYLPQARALNETDLAIANLVKEHGPLLAKHIRAQLPRHHQTSEQNIRRIFSTKLCRYYGFTNDGDNKGYHAPPEPTW